MVEHPRLFLREDHRAAGPVGEALEHDASLALPDLSGLRPSGPLERAERLGDVIAERAVPVRERRTDHWIVPQQPRQMTQGVFEDLRNLDGAGAPVAPPRAKSARPTGTATSDSGGSVSGSSTTAMYVRKTSPCSNRHDVECTRRGASGYQARRAARGRRVARPLPGLRGGTPR